MLASWDQLSKMTYDEAEKADTARENWERYCYEFRDRVYRYSQLGVYYAALYAKRKGIPLPYSDRSTVP